MKSSRCPQPRERDYSTTAEESPTVNPFYHRSFLRTRENFEEETMQSSKTLDQQILEKFALLTEENQMQVLAMLTVILSGGAA